MIITLFNGLSGLQVRGISKVADELATHLRKHGHIVHEVKIPRFLYFKSSLATGLMLILFQQLVCPLTALKTRSNLVIDPYNGFSVLACLFVKTKYFIHDFTPFKRNYWFFRPGTLYQFILFKLDSIFSLAEMYHDGLDIETPWFLQRSTVPKVFPCIVDPLNTSNSDFFLKNIQPTLAEADTNCMLLSTISGTGWNKDFDGLVARLSSLAQPFLLVAFGFGDQGIERKVVTMPDGRVSYVFTVGFVDEAAIASVIILSHLFVFHSLSEGFGRPILEALQLRKLVVSVYAPVVGLLSTAALENVFIYQTQSEFNSAIAKALGSQFVSFSVTYKAGIDASIEEFLK